MNIVYKLIFKSRLERGEPPYYYIGSKTNCSIVDGEIIDKRGKQYLGSSRYPDYKQIIKNEIIELELLHVGDDVLSVEKQYQLDNNVVKSTDYFNLSIATVSPYNTVGYGAYKHHITGKTIKLPIDDPSVLSGEYVGVSSGCNLSDETKLKISKAHTGENNGFYGKRHKPETLELLSYKTSERLRSMSESTKREIAIKVSSKLKGVPKSEHWKQQLRDRDFGKQVKLIHPELGSILVDFDDPDRDKIVTDLKSNGYMNPYALAIKENRVEKFECPNCGGKFVKAMLSRWHGVNCKSLKPAVEKGPSMSGKHRKGRTAMRNLETLEILDIDVSERLKYEKLGWVTNAKYIRSIKPK